MTVHALPTPVLTPGIEAARGLVGEAAEVPVDRVAGAEIAEAIAAAAGLEAQAASLKLALTAEADRRELAAQAAATGTDAWAAALTGDTREVMNGGIRLARLLEERYPATREAFRAGLLNLKQARVIVDAAEQISDHATAEQVAQAEEWLVDRATGASTRSGRGLNPKRLRQAARRMCRVACAELAAGHEAAMLHREARGAEAETFLNLQDNGDGSYSGRFRVPELHGSLLSTYLQSLTSPRRLNRGRDGEQVIDPTVPGWNLSYTEHLGLGLCELIEHLPTQGHAGRSAITLLVQTRLETLQAGLGGGTLDGGTGIGPGDLRRLACNAGILPAVMGGESVPLDLGRQQRLHSWHQRVALATMHQTCAATGCERPLAWCEIHHPHAWADGGHTDLDNALPLCFFHHRRAHDDRFDLRRHPTGQWRFHRRR
jgi:hypothetical protein